MKWILITLGITLLICYASFLYVSQDKFGVSIVPDPCQSNGGIVTCSYRQSIKNATTTACSRQSPSATSTIVHASFDVRTSTSSAQLIQIGKSSNGYATTTLLANLSLLASTRGTLVATSTLDTNDNLIIAPNNFVVINIGASYGSTNPTGSCEFIFRVI